MPHRDLLEDNRQMREENFLFSIIDKQPLPFLDLGEVNLPLEKASAKISQQCSLLIRGWQGHLGGSNAATSPRELWATSEWSPFDPHGSYPEW